MKKPRLLDPEFDYTPAAVTDIRRLFARVRRQLKLERERNEAEVTMKVKPLKKAETK